MQVGKDCDPEEIAKYFPSFLWVLWDFSVQLIDKQGHWIKSNTYLENSLQIQKGNSEAIEWKNWVRRLIQTYFPDWDCATLVRPFEDEDVL